MADPNITKVYLLNVPLENDYKHTLYFDSASAQKSYFDGKRVSGCSFTDFSYQRKDGFIRVPLHYDTLVSQGVNYVMYQNSAYNTERWFYAFITDMKYVDDGRTDIYIETDVMQTWMFDIDVKASFVEREHCADDTVGLHTYPEALETGEYVCNGHVMDESLRAGDDNSLMIVVGITIDKDGAGYEAGLKYNGMYSAVCYLAWSMTQADKVSEYIDSLARAGEVEKVQCVFIAPYNLCKGATADTGRGVPTSNDPETHTVQILTNTALDGYGSKVKNNKVKTYPYNYLLVTNNSGGSAVYQYELFKAAEPIDPEFKVQGVLTPGCSIRLVPMYYKGVALNDDEGLNLGKYPICNWTSDIYTNWLTQNSANIAVSMGGSALSILGGAALLATGGGAMVGGGMIAGGVGSIAGKLAQINQQSYQPPQANGNLNCGDVVTASNRNTFHFYNMSIKKEYAQIIDEYFTMFGYKTCRVKVPEKNHRPHFWYTKTIDVSIDGSIPNRDMQKIKECYNNGITFWKSTAKIGDYSVDNSIN